MINKPASFGLNLLDQESTAELDQVKCEERLKRLLKRYIQNEKIGEYLERMMKEVRENGHLIGFTPCCKEGAAGLQRLPMRYLFVSAHASAAPTGLSWPELANRANAPRGGYNPAEGLGDKLIKGVPAGFDTSLFINIEFNNY